MSATTLPGIRAKEVAGSPVVRRRRLGPGKPIKFGAAIGPVLLLAVWSIGSATGWIDPRSLTAPWTVVTTAGDLIADGRLQSNLWTSTQRAFIGLGFGIVLIRVREPGSARLRARAFAGLDEETQASRSALLAAASSFLAGDPRAQAWAERARSLAASFPASVCRAPQIELVLSQGALSKRLAGSDLSVEFDTGIRGIQTGRTFSRCSPFPSRYETAGPVDVVSPGESLAIAIRDSHVVASYLLQRYLWQFPPGSQCEIDDEDGDLFRGSRF